MSYSFSKEEIKQLQKIIKEQGYYDPSDCRKTIVEFDSLCGLCASYFELIDLALEHLAIKAQNNKIELYVEKPKTDNIEVIVEGTKIEKKLKNKPLPLFDWDILEIRRTNKP